MGSIITVVTGGPRRPKRSMLIYTALWYLVLLAFGNLSSMSTGLPALLLAGFVQSVAMIAMTANLLAASDERVPRAGHGRAHAGDLRHAARSDERSARSSSASAIR